MKIGLEEINRFLGFKIVENLIDGKFKGEVDKGFAVFEEIGVSCGLEDGSGAKDRVIALRVNCGE